jgi:hypothetical protein
METSDKKVLRGGKKKYFSKSKISAVKNKFDMILENDRILIQ